MHYGKTLPLLIDKAVEFEEGEEKKQLIQMVANHMKKCFTSFNKEGVDDRKIFDDIREFSKGNLDLNEDSMRLVNVKETTTNTTPGKTNNKQNKKSNR